MRRLLLVLFTFVVCMAAQAQQFNGIELSGNRKEFTSRYLQGRTTASVFYRAENETAVKDKFLNSPVTIYIQQHPSSNTDDKWCVWFDIIFPKSADWAAMEKKYNEVLAYFTKQYGEPNKWLQHRKFGYPYNNGNHKGNELIALKYTECEYSDSFYIGSWRLVISLEYVDDVANNTTYYSIMVNYFPI